MNLEKKTNRILLVEDTHVMQLSMQGILGEEGLGFEVIAAYSVEEGMSAFQAFAGQFDMIVVDGELKIAPTIKERTCGLIRWIREQGYRGPLVAWSGMPWFRKEQLDAGCDIEMDRKEDLPKFIEESLKAPAASEASN